MLKRSIHSVFKGQAVSCGNSNQSVQPLLVSSRLHMCKSWEPLTMEILHWFHFQLCMPASLMTKYLITSWDRCSNVYCDHVCFQTPNHILKRVLHSTVYTISRDFIYPHFLGHWVRMFRSNEMYKSKKYLNDVTCSDKVQNVKMCWSCNLLCLLLSP